MVGPPIPKGSVKTVHVPASSNASTCRSLAGRVLSRSRLSRARLFVEVSTEQPNPLRKLLSECCRSAQGSFSFGDPDGVGLVRSWTRELLFGDDSLLMWLPGMGARAAPTVPAFVVNATQSEMAKPAPAYVAPNPSNCSSGR